MIKKSDAAAQGLVREGRIIFPSVSALDDAIAAALLSIREADIAQTRLKQCSCLRVPRLQEAVRDNAWTPVEQRHLDSCERCQSRINRLRELGEVAASGSTPHEQSDLNHSSPLEPLPFVEGEPREHGAMNAGMTSILVADDYPVVRSGVRALLERQEGWKVIAEADNGRDAVKKAMELRPEVIILDVSMPELNGLDATRLILKTVPETRVLVLTSCYTAEMIERALQVGVRGYVLKSDAEADLVAAIKALLAGRTFFTSAVSELVVEHLWRSHHRTVQPVLTVREAEIVQLLAEGHSNKQVGGILGISSRTVENHRAQIMQRLGLHSFSELIRYAIRIGIAEP